jgi:phosphopantothenoylcysteine decarboxylase/phosphopantothenate--cysteine ligase
MAAAVADYRPKVDPAFFGGKFRRKTQTLHLELEPTPDLLAQVAATRRPLQLMVGFALEPREELLASARAKLERKKIDLVVGNPLETMDGETIDAVVLGRDGTETRTPGPIGKPEFAGWLMGLIEARVGRGAA